jgi:hypothetical protein
LQAIKLEFDEISKQNEIKSSGTKRNLTPTSGTRSEFGGGRREKRDAGEKPVLRGLTGHRSMKRAATEDRGPPGASF